MRACIINQKGDIVGLATENIGLWEPKPTFYVRCYGWTGNTESWTDWLIRSNPLLIFGGLSANRSGRP